MNHPIDPTDRPPSPREQRFLLALLVAIVVVSLAAVALLFALPDEADAGTSPASLTVTPGICHPSDPPEREGMFIGIDNDTGQTIESIRAHLTGTPALDPTVAVDYWRTIAGDGTIGDGERGYTIVHIPAAYAGTLTATIEAHLTDGTVVDLAGAAEVRACETWPPEPGVSSTVLERGDDVDAEPLDLAPAVTVAPASSPAAAPVAAAPAFTG